MPRSTALLISDLCATFFHLLYLLSPYIFAWLGRSWPAWCSLFSNSPCSRRYSLSDCRIWLVETSCHNSPHFLCLAENPDGVVFFTIQVSMFKDSPSVSIGSLQLATKKTLFTSPRDYCTPSIFFVRPLVLISENDTHNLPGYRDIFKAFRLQFKLIIHVVTLI